MRVGSLAVPLVWNALGDSHIEVMRCVVAQHDSGWSISVVGMVDQCVIGRDQRGAGWSPWLI